MAKALVIKNADFEANRVAKVELSDLKPCTGISLDRSAISAASFADQKIIASVSPAGCTDPVTWASSDDQVATVSNGIVSIHGLGTATITAACGEHSSSCTVTVDNVEITAGFRFGSLYAAGSNDFATATVPGNYKSIVYSDEVPLDTNRLRYARNASFVGDFNLAPAPLPSGVGSVELVSNDVSGVYYILFYDSARHADNQPLVAKQMMKNAPSAPSNGIVDSTYNVPSGADSYGISLTYKTQYTSEDSVDAIMAAKGTKIVLRQAAVNE